MRVWKLISHHDDPEAAFEAHVAQGLISVGWNNVGNLALRRPNDASDVGSWIRESHPKLNNSGTGGPSLWNFYAEMQEGDYVIASGKNRFRGVFRITGPYEYREGDNLVFEYAHARQAQLVDLDARSLWEACGSAIEGGQSPHLTVALCAPTDAAAALVSGRDGLYKNGARHAVNTSHASQFNATPRLSTWNEWALAVAASYSDWQDAGRGLSGCFPRIDESRSKRRETIRNEGRTFWVMIQRPLPGVHLIAFSLDRTDVRTKVVARVWVHDERPDVYARFAQGRPFSLDSAATSRTTGIRPQHSFEWDLRRQSVAVTGIFHGVELALLGPPGSTVLSNLFRQFCSYALTCYQQTLFTEPEASLESPHEDIEAQDWALDEQSITAIAQLDLSATEKLAVAKVRVDQSGYRRRLLERWDEKCSVTGLAHKDLLVASHILPWSACKTPRDRWSPDNGLLLPPGLDKAFELGVIGFDDRGKLLMSKRAVRVDIQAAMGIRPGDGIRDFHRYPGLIPYLRQHREIHALTLNV